MLVFGGIQPADRVTPPGRLGAAAAAPTTRRGWAGFRQAYLFDYNRASIRFWLALVGIGVLALTVATVQIAVLPPFVIVQILVLTLIVALAAAFPVEMPSSQFTLSACDVFVFLLLVQHGPAAAAIGAAVEGCVASWRSAPRLSSRIATTVNSATAMYASGMLFELALATLRAAHVPVAGAQLGALALAALVYYPASTLPLMQVLYLKKGKSLGLRAWLASTASIGTLYLGGSVVAGFLFLNAQHFGESVIAVAAVVVAVSITLLRVHFGQQIIEDAAQEALLEAARRDAEQNQQRFHAAFTFAAIGMAIVAPDGTIAQANQSLCALLGSPASTLIGLPFGQLMHPGDAALLEGHADGVATRRDESFSIELRCFGPGQPETWVSLHCGPFGDASTAHAGLIYQLHDITSRRRAEGDLQHIAYHDSLTDLANRSCFHERLSGAVQRQRADPRAGFAVMYLDLDRFKIVNDSLGHTAGDQLLKIAAARISANVRPGDLVARLGGDEFAVLLEGAQDHDDLAKLGERLLLALAEPVSLGGTEVRPAASIGLTFSDISDRQPAEVLRDADLAMYKAKADGKGRLAVFDARLTEQIGHKLQLEADLRRAIAEGQLSLVYQPLFQLEPYRLCGFEALARWIHPVRGFVGPDVFIALAEETGCIEALTYWAVEEAVRQHAAWWRAAPAQLGDMVMHVNVSGKDLSKPQFVGNVLGVLARHGLPARLLVLEITESTLMEHREAALAALVELRAAGVKLGIDDFGTGYSSLAYLSILPFDCLKIDRSFVIGMELSPQNIEIVRTVVSLGRSLNKEVVAEGIETQAQFDQVKLLGATIGQGYLMSRPLPPAQVEALLERELAGASAADADIKSDDKRVVANPVATAMV